MREGEIEVDISSTGRDVTTPFQISTSSGHRSDVTLSSTRARRMTSTRRPTTTTMSSNTYDRPCPPSHQHYCLHGGTCHFVSGINTYRCDCTTNWGGKRCQDPVFNFGPVRDGSNMNQPLTITGFTAAGVIILGLICITAYIIAKNKRDRFHARRASRDLQKKNNTSHSSLLCNNNDCDETVIDIKSPPVDVMPKESTPAYQGNKSIPAPVSDRHVGNYGVGQQTLPDTEYSNTSDPLRSRLPAVSKTPDVDLNETNVWDVNSRENGYEKGDRKNSNQMANQHMPNAQPTNQSYHIEMDTHSLVNGSKCNSQSTCTT